MGGRTPVVTRREGGPLERGAVAIPRLPAGQPLLRDGQALQHRPGTCFGNITPGWQRVQAICDFVHNHLTFGYQYARSTRTAYEAYEERLGVCRDFAHLAVTLCRCMNIPTRYANGFLGDIGVPLDPAPMDYNAWFEVYLDHKWYIFDARHNMPRIGRITVSRGRDATDIPLATSFGPHFLNVFKVWTDEVGEDVPARARVAAGLSRAIRASNAKSRGAASALSFICAVAAILSGRWRAGPRSRRHIPVRGRRRPRAAHRPARPRSRGR